MTEQLALRIIAGGLEPADNYTRERLREKGYHVGDVVFGSLRKARNPGFHRLAHVFGKMVAENIQDFDGMDAHRVLKRLQWESGMGCEEMGVKVPGIGYTLLRLPQSLSFASMSEEDFREIFRGLCRHVAKQYWRDLDEYQIEEMARVMADE